MNQVPLLFLGDSPSLGGGLSRIGRDLATLASKMEEFRVGFLGRGGLQTSRLPFTQYNFPEYGQWGEDWLQDVWNDFAHGEEGIVFTIWDPSRLTWFANPVGMPNESWLRNPPFKRWGYFPIDHEGVGGMLTTMSGVTLAGYDRLLAYGLFGATVISKTLNYKQGVDWMPHGINMDTFQPRDGTGVRAGFGMPKNSTVVGVVMTNQQRKDWGLAFEIISLLKAQVKGLKVWCKTDSIDRHWDLRALAADFQVEDVVVIDLKSRSDLEMSYLYSMCDLTMLPSLGEGFGYPIVESLACGVPCVTGDYAGGAELVPDPSWLVKSALHRWDTRHNCMRPVFEADDWVVTIMKAFEAKLKGPDMRASVEHLNWSNLYVQWQKWLREGLK